MQNAPAWYLLQNIFDTERLEAEREWKPLRPGVDISIIYESDNEAPMAGFIRYQPGASVPAHMHKGFEHILILDGSQQDGKKTYSKGMLVIHTPGTCHNILSSQGCLALAIWQKPVEFMGAEQG